MISLTLRDIHLGQIHDGQLMPLQPPPKRPSQHAFSTGNENAFIHDSSRATCSRYCPYSFFFIFSPASRNCSVEMKLKGAGARAEEKVQGEKLKTEMLKFYPRKIRKREGFRLKS